MRMLQLVSYPAVRVSITILILSIYNYISIAAPAPRRRGRGVAINNELAAAGTWVLSFVQRRFHKHAHR
eukprot:SAG11_NODE_1591_length_4618_cov_3.431069_2_plen_69_part_00